MTRRRRFQAHPRRHDELRLLGETVAFLLVLAAVVVVLPVVAPWQ